jgi:hypothetical protein
MTQYILVDSYQPFEENCCHHPYDRVISYVCKKNIVDTEKRRMGLGLQANLFTLHSVLEKRTSRVTVSSFCFSYILSTSYWFIQSHHFFYSL